MKEFKYLKDNKYDNTLNVQKEIAYQLKQLNETIETVMNTQKAIYNHLNRIADRLEGGIRILR